MRTLTELNHLNAYFTLFVEVDKISLASQLHDLDQLEATCEVDQPRKRPMVTVWTSSARMIMIDGALET